MPAEDLSISAFHFRKIDRKYYCVLLSSSFTVESPGFIGYVKLLTNDNPV